MVTYIRRTIKQTTPRVWDKVRRVPVEFMDMFDEETKMYLKKMNLTQKSVLLEPLPGEENYEQRMTLFRVWLAAEKSKELTLADIDVLAHRVSESNQEAIEEAYRYRRFEPWPDEESEGCNADFVV